MPHSDGSLRPWVLDQLQGMGLGGFAHVVDVGAGSGAWRDFLGPATAGASWTAVEIWESYVGEYRLAERYDEVVLADVRELDPLPAADLYIFGDVLEHMPRDEAITLWERARAVAGVLVINLPVLDYPQGEVGGNPYEAHLHQWDMGSVLAGFPGITASSGPPPGSTVGAFIAEGTRSEPVEH